MDTHPHGHPLPYLSILLYIPPRGHPSTPADTPPSSYPSPWTSLTVYIPLHGHPSPWTTIPMNIPPHIHLPMDVPGHPTHGHPSPWTPPHLIEPSPWTSIPMAIKQARPWPSADFIELGSWEHGCCGHHGSLCPFQSQKVPLLVAERLARTCRTPWVLSSNVTGPCGAKEMG